jgi:nucleotide-binding universal stress UspA family protein
MQIDCFWPGPAQTITELSESEHADMILVASQGCRGLDRALEIGGVADRVMQTAQRTVLLVFASQPRA